MKSRLTILALLTLVLSSCATAPTRAPVVITPEPRPAPSCLDCGRIERIEVKQVARPAAKRGAVLSGVVGGVLTKPASAAATPAVAAKQPVYRLSVRMDDGRHLVLIQNVISPNLRVGSLVRVSNGRVVLMR